MSSGGEVTMPSKMVTDRKKSADSVAAAARSPGTAVLGAAQRTLNLVVQKNEVIPDFASATEYLAA
jgi:hypothetical protein